MSTGNRPVRVLVVTAMYPHPENVAEGIFVKTQSDSLSKLNANIQVDVLCLRGHRQLRYLSGALKVLFATLKTRYSIVHAHYGLAALPALFRAGTPLVVSLHGSDVNILWQRRLSKLACRFAKGIIVQSPAMHALLGMPNARVIPVGIDMELFRPMDKAACRVALGLPPEEMIVLFPGDPRRAVKRFDLFEQAIEVLRATGRQLDILTLPAGRYEHDQMPTVLNACDLMVLTSDTEGSPMVIKEALACNIPIVSVDAGDVTELIGNVVGCYLSSRNANEIAHKIEDALLLAGRTDGRENMSHLKEEEIAKRILEVYAEANPTLKIASEEDQATLTLRREVQPEVQSMGSPVGVRK
jgi:teichuronic acid biosynthesis glycosyltransferase TuaC